MTNGEEEQMNFVSELFIRPSCSRLRSYVTKCKGQNKVRRQACERERNGLNNKHVVSTINLDFLKPRVSQEYIHL